MSSMHRLEITRRTIRRHQGRVALVLIIPSVVFIYLAISVQPRTIVHHQSNSIAAANDAQDAVFKDSKTDNDCCNLRHKQKRKAVLIFAVMRSGSSFLGELFNQHAEVYYLFEPLYAVGYDADALRKRRELLHDLLRCNYSRVPEFYKDTANDVWSKCRTNICFAGRSKFLWRNSDLCENKPPYCGPGTLDPNLLARTCRQSLFTAIKTIRVQYLKDLEPILKDPELDLRVIQLVRDPRAIVSSRMKYVTFLDDPETFVKSIISLCRNTYHNFVYAENCIFGDGKAKPRSYGENDKFGVCEMAISRLWKGRFMRISHEYASEQPYDAWRDVYGFSEVNFDLEVLKWIKTHTTENAPKVREKKDIPGNYFDTTRISSEVLNAWKREMGFDVVQSVQSTCKSAMRSLGYSLLTNATEQAYLKRKLYDHKKAVKISWTKLEP